MFVRIGYTYYSGLADAISSGKSYLEFEAITDKKFKNPVQVQAFTDNGCISTGFVSADNTEDVQLSIINHKLILGFLLSSYNTKRGNNLNKIFPYITE